MRLYRSCFITAVTHPTQKGKAMLSLIFTLAIGAAHIVCFAQASAEIERIRDMPYGPQRFPRQWRTNCTVAIAIFISALAFAGLVTVGF